MDFRTFAKSSGPPPNLPIPPGVITNSVSQQLNNLRMTESSMSSMLRTQQEHARSLERMATMQRQIIEMQQIQTQQLHSMQQMMLPLAFQCNAFMSSMSSLVPGVGNLFTQPLTFVQSALGSSGTLCDPSHGLPGSSPGPLVQSAVLPAGPGPSMLTPSGSEPTRRRLDLQPGPLHELQRATSSVQIPRYGLYHHVKQSGTSNTPERIWSSVSERVVPPVRNETVCFTIGRTQTDDPFQTSHEVKEMVHPQLKTQGFQFWVALPVATFSSELLVGANDLFKTIDILFLYQQMLRIHKSIADNPFRVKNAFEDGMLIEDTRCQQWIPNADHFNSSRGYITHEDAVNHTQFWHDYISTDLKHRFSAQLRNPVLRDSVLTSLRFLVTALGRYSNNVSLVEKFEIIFNSQQQPIAIYAHLALPQWRADNFDIFQYFGFGHNTSVLGMASAVREGVVRPSSCDVRSPDWLTPNTFYSRGVLFNDDSSFSRKHVLKILEQAKKFGGLNTARPICIVGRAFARQAHIRTPQGGVYADQLLGYFFDVVHGSDSRWAFRSHLSTIHGVATFIS